MPSMPNPWRSKTYATHDITYYDPWPFSTWGIDIIGKIHPTATNGHEFILIAIDYFTKWVKVASYKILNSKKVAQFIQTNIIYKYEVTHEIISNNGFHFQGETKKLLDNSIFNTISLHLTVLKLME